MYHPYLETLRRLPPPSSSWEPIRRRRGLKEGFATYGSEPALHGLFNLPNILPSNSDLALYDYRHLLVRMFSFAILDEEALEDIAEHGPLLSVGAGSGYNEWLLRNLGVDVIAVDNKPGGENDYGQEWAWTEVLEMEGAEAARIHSDRTLFLCWSHGWEMDVLNAYEGDTIIYVGEWYGCCCSDEFCNTLEDDWECLRELQIPQYVGINDYLSIWRRI